MCLPCLLRDLGFPSHSLGDQVRAFTTEGPPLSSSDAVPEDASVDVEMDLSQPPEKRDVLC